MAFAAAAPWIIQGLGFLGGVLGNRGQKQQQTSQTQSNSGSSFKNATNTATSSNPLLAPGYAEFINGIKDRYIGLMDKDPNLSGYQAAQTSDINRSYDLQGANQQQQLASRGITGPAAGLAMNAQNTRRIGDVVRLKQQTPLLARQLQQDTMDRALNVFNAMPRGTYNETSGGSEGFGNEFANQASQGTAAQPGNALGGGIGNLANLMAFLFGQGAFGGNHGSPVQGDATTSGRV